MASIRPWSGHWHLQYNRTEDYPSMGACGRDVCLSIWVSRKPCLGYPWQSRVSQAQHSALVSPATSQPLSITRTDPACLLCRRITFVAPFGFVLLVLHSSKSALGPTFHLFEWPEHPFHCNPHFPTLHSLLMLSVFPALLSKPPVSSMLILGRQETWVRWKVETLVGLGELAGFLCQYSYHLPFLRKTS